MRKLFCSWLIFAAVCSAGAVAEKSIAETTKGMRKLDGYFPIYWDESQGKLWLEVSHWDHDFLYIPSLPAGVGSNDIGLDRGLIPGSKLVRFEKSGPRVLLIEENSRFRSSSANAMEQRTVTDSFATSVLWGLEAAAQDGAHILVDATQFFEHDEVSVAQMISQAHQGSYRIDPSRCVVYLPRVKAFPKNTEVEVVLTFEGDKPGEYVKDVVPSPESITVREHHSFVDLPEAGYEPRVFDPRAGYFDLTYRDYSVPLGTDPDRRLLTRHRLIKRESAGQSGEPVEPIVYYIDGGAPDDVRRALQEGASWWEQAFEAAGFTNAFQVKILPPDVDPMDIRYNVVQWVHRFTRGWSYGNGIVDPRTGEILKGQVTLGSLRYRQDYLIFSGLLSPFGDDPRPLESVREAVYSRLRQLAAHKVGHTLALAHNYVASTDHNASVMDYPHPWIDLRNDGSLDISHAYPSGIGEWDKVAIRYGYTQFPSGADSKKQLNEIISEAARSGDIFISDADSRPLSSAHPRAHLWDSGPNATDELRRILKVRQAALNHFGATSIPEGEVMSRLDETLVPVYFLHRYQTEAAAKMLGGLDYTYAVRGDGQLITKIVPAVEQRRALESLIATLSPAALTIPERIITLIAPHPPGYDRTRESFPARTGLTFDPIAAAEAAADLSASLLFNPERAARLAEHHARDASNPGLEEVINTVARSTWLAPARPGLPGQLKAATDIVVVKRLLALTVGTKESPVASQIAFSALTAQRSRLPAYLLRLLQEFERTPKEFQLPYTGSAAPTANRPR